MDGDTVVVQKETYGDSFARPARLSPLEAKALLWALEFIGDRLPIEAGGSLSSVRQKLEAAIGRRTRSRPSSWAAPRSPIPASPRRWATRSARTACWRSSTGPSRAARITRRTIEPHLLVNARDAWYVVAYCRRADGQRTFRLDRIRSALLLEEHFERRAEITSTGPYHALGRPPGAGRDRRHRAHRCGAAPRRLRWMLEKHASRERFADGSVLVEIPYASEDWLVKELLKYQGEAVLFEPVALRRTVTDLAAQVLDRYSADADRPSGGRRRRAPTR